MSFLQRFIWRIRLLIFPTARLALHLPSEGWDHDEQWRTFSRSEHRAVRQEIENYFGSRFGGMSFEVLQKGSEGEWQGRPEKNTIFYLDLDFRFVDIEWFSRMKNVWAGRNRFNQDVIYITLHPIWILESQKS